MSRPGRLQGQDRSAKHEGTPWISMALPLSGGRMMRRDWLASMALHGALLGGAFWLVAVPVPQVQRLDVALRWAAPEPVPPTPPQVEPTPPAPPRVEPTSLAPQPKQAPRVRPVKAQRPRVQASTPKPRAAAQVFESAPLQSAPALALPVTPATPAAAATPSVPAAAAELAAVPAAPAIAAAPVASQLKAPSEAPPPGLPALAYAPGAGPAEQQALSGWRTPHGPDRHRGGPVAHRRRR